MNRRKNIILLVLIIGLSYIFITNFNQGNATMISPEQVMNKLENGEDFVLLDVRTREEYSLGRIPGSLLIPLDELDRSIESVIQDKNAEIIIYCRSGNRSKTAVSILKNKGYKNVYDLGGILSWPYEIEK